MSRIMSVKIRGGPALSTSDHTPEHARQHAWRIIRTNQGELGFRAAGRAYPQVWARDAIIAGLGVAAAGSADDIDALRRSLRSLAAAQSRLGRIPNHVRRDERDDIAADTVFAGAVDASLWYIIGHDVLSRSTSDGRDLAGGWESLQNAYRWLEYQDANECGLLEVHESMDWADLFANRYNSLLPNVLWFGANLAMSRIASRLDRDGSAYAKQAESIRFKINQLLWVGPEVSRDTAWIKANREEWLYPTRLVDTMLVTRPYYLPYMAFRDYGDRFDTLGNLLAVLFGLADDAQSSRILDYITETGMAKPWPIKACWPPITTGDKDWREYYRQYNLNLSDQYHNGGAWPYLGGFYVGALVRAGRMDDARQTLDSLAEMNRQSRYGGEWEFNEWFHGLSGRPMGHILQTWSAGMFLYADTAVRDGECPFFDQQPK